MKRGSASKGKSLKPLTDEQKRKRKMKRVLGVGQAKDIKAMKKSSAMKKKTTPKRKNPKLEKKLDKLDKKAGKIIEGFRKTLSKQNIKSAATGLAGFKKSSALKKISAACKAAAKRKFKVWPSAYASGWGVRCTRAGGPSSFGGGKKKK